MTAFEMTKQANVYDIALELEETSGTLYYVYYLQYSVGVINASLKSATLE